MSRRINYREEVPTFLIVCEGTETEPNYFCEFHIGHVVHVKVKGIGRSTVKLVKEAIKLKEVRDYEKVWVVFDIDDCTSSQVSEAIKLSKSNGIAVAYSNQSFELWFLLHFNFHDTALGRKQYCQKLSDLLGSEYLKNGRDLYIRLLSRQVDAIRNSKRLFDLYPTSNEPNQNDPCTTVFKLVEELNRYGRDSRRL